MRAETVRQDRMDLTGQWALAVGTHALPVRNIAPFGIGVIAPEGLPEDLVKVGAELEGCLRYRDANIQQARFRVVRIEPVEGLPATIGLEIIGERIDVAAVKGVTLAYEIIDRNREETARTAEIPIAFKAATAEVYAYLKSFEDAVRGAEPSLGMTAEGSYGVSEQALRHVLVSELEKQFPKLYLRLGQEFAALKASERQVSADYFRTLVGSLVYQAPIADRSFRKPRGYAGDFEMMNLIYRDGYEGSSLFGRCLHKFFIGEPSAKAVRNRANYLRRRILERIAAANGKHLRILSVASGPAFEVQMVVKELGAKGLENVSFTLLDQDLESLKHAQLHVRSICQTVELNLVHRSIRDVFKGQVRLEGFDLIYSAGLFDYFTDPVANAAASLLFGALRDGGELIIGNFDVENPNLPVMDIIMDWKLIYRSRHDLVAIYSPVTPRLNVEKEELGINLFCVMPK